METTVTPTDHQFKAIRAAAEWYKGAYDESMLFDASTCVLAGYAGSGKSTCLPFIIDQIGLDPNSVAFCAPTGKAAKVMTKSLRRQGMNEMATTIHSLIYLPKPTTVDKLETQLKEATAARTILTERVASPDDKIMIYSIEKELNMHEIDVFLKVVKKELDKAYVSKEGPQFSLNPISKVTDKKLIVVDEGSMVNEKIASDLKSFGIPILVMGDPGQLPPVDGDFGFNMDTPELFLSEIHRQALDNPIIQLATLARKGELLKVGSYGDGRARVIPRAKDDVTLNPDADVQVIVGTHKKRWDITSKIRHVLDYNSNAPEVGEPLICCRNSRSRVGMTNGSMYTVKEAPEKLVDGDAAFRMTVQDEDGMEHTCIVYQGLFEEHIARKQLYASADKDLAYRTRNSAENFDWAWAVTCHKAQGSGWDNVVLHDESGVFRDHSFKWLYTGITRAIETLTVVV